MASISTKILLARPVSRRYAVPFKAPAATPTLRWILHYMDSALHVFCAMQPGLAQRPPSTLVGTFAVIVIVMDDVTSAPSAVAVTTTVCFPGLTSSGKVAFRR